MSVRWRSVGLVARRELTVRVRQKSFVVSAMLSLFLVAAISLYPAVMSGPFGDEPRVVAAVDDRGAKVARMAAAAADLPATAAAAPLAPSAPEIEVRRLHAGPAQAALEAGDVAAVVSADGIRVGRDRSSALVGVLQEAHRRQAAVDALVAAGVSPASARRALTSPPLAVTAVRPVDPQAAERAGIAFVAVLLLYTQLLTFGYFVASGVVEEKASRVVELLLAAVRPGELLAGKLLGIGALGLLQLLAIASVGMAAAAATGALDLSVDVLVAVALAVAWFVLGYAFYSSLFACAGALVPRQDELQSATMPLNLVIVICFLLAFAVLEQPDGTLARASAFVPPLAPMTLPPRIALGEATALEVVGGAAGVVAATAALLPLAARIYAGALLGTRTRVKVADAWRAAGRPAA